VVSGSGRSPAATQGGADDRDARLVERCRAGDQAAFNLIVQHYQPLLLRHCSRIAGAASGQDAVQDALLCAWNALRAGVEVHTLRPWLYTIAHRSAIATLDGERHPASLEFADTLTGGRSTADEASQAARLRETLTALAGLPEPQRAALIGSAVHGKTGSQLARQLGISECTARQLVFKARATLRAGASACLLPPAIVLRLIRRVADLPGRVATTIRGGAVADQVELTGRLLKLAATAVAGITLVGSGALHLVTHPAARARRAHASIAVPGPSRPELGDFPRVPITLAHTDIASRRIGERRSRRTAARGFAIAHSTATAPPAEPTPAVTGAVTPPATGLGDGAHGPAIPVDVARTPVQAPNQAASTSTGTTPAVANPAATTPAATTPAATTPAATPAVTTPAVTTPSVTIPAITVPSITIPSVSLPAVSTPVVSLSSVSTPVITLPAVTTPVITLPAVTTPPVTLPGLSSPQTSTPPATVPVVTVGGISLPL
jgi:RNA polymerase sigma factor (sigma-70 family)